MAACYTHSSITVTVLTPTVSISQGSAGTLVTASLQLCLIADTASNLHYLILTLASMILVLATSKGVVTAAAKPPVCETQQSGDV